MTVDVSSHLVLALDLDDLASAIALAKELKPWFGVAKVGLELFSAAGPAAVSAMADLGYDVFVDVKLHDIPTTVAKACRVLGSSGATYLTIHTSGGLDMLRAGNEAFRDAALAAGQSDPRVLAVTVLTSDGQDAAVAVPDRVRLALDAGCGGVVCAVSEAPLARALGPDLVILTPGIRPLGSPAHDQQRVATPQEALAAGSDLLVIGRAVTQAEVPMDAARQLVESLKR